MSIESFNFCRYHLFDPEEFINAVSLVPLRGTGGFPITRKPWHVIARMQRLTGLAPDHVGFSENRGYHGRPRNGDVNVFSWGK